MLFRSKAGSSHYWFVNLNYLASSQNPDDPATFDDDTEWQHVPWGGNYVVPLVGDFDGNGKDDIAYYQRGGDPWNFFIHLTNDDGTGFSNTIWYLKLTNLTSGTVPLIGDFNGDGLDDFVVYNTQGYPNWNFSISNTDYNKPGGWPFSKMKESIEEPESYIHPILYQLSQNYPNPFNPLTTIPFDLPEACHVKIIVYNILGQKVAELADRYYEQGSYSVTFNGNNQASGIYIVRAIMILGEKAGQKHIFSKKIMLMK